MLRTQAAEAMREELTKTGKFVDLDITYRGGKPEVAIHVDRNNAADLGVPNTEANLTPDMLED